MTWLNDGNDPGGSELEINCLGSSLSSKSIVYQYLVHDLTLVLA